MAGEGRRLPRQKYYPVTTRGRKSSESFGNDRVALWFGTEGSEVQILSPRPLNRRNWPVFLREDRPFVFVALPEVLDLAISRWAATSGT